jgi:hypothetical protein
MMNSSFVVDLARGLLNRPEVKSLTDEDKRIETLYRLAYQRPPSPVEVKLGKHFLEVQSGVKTVAAEEPAWKYGYGEYDDRGRRLKNFNALNSQGGGAWKMADSRFGQLNLKADGGTPGANRQLAAIRRWTAPRDATVAIEATLAHQLPPQPAPPKAAPGKNPPGKNAPGKSAPKAPPADNPDGVQAYVVSSRTGELGRWTALNRTVDTKIARVDVKKGDTIDFIVDCMANDKNDAFKWSPNIRIADDAMKSMAMGGGMANSSAGGVREWKAQADFDATRGSSGPKPLDTWEKYAQVLLLANEVSFVD